MRRYLVCGLWTGQYAYKRYDPGESFTLSRNWLMRGDAISPVSKAPKRSKHMVNTLSYYPVTFYQRAVYCLLAPLERKLLRAGPLSVMFIVNSQHLHQ